jgi:ketosteroid isomerase-like protein
MKLLFATIVLGLFTACGNTSTVQSGNALNAEDFAKKYFETFNDHKWQELYAYYAGDAEFLDPSLGTKPVKQTKAQFIEKYTNLGIVFPDLKDKVSKVYQNNQNIIVEFTSSGTGPDSVKFESPMCAILTVENGKITRDATYYDNE